MEDFEKGAKRKCTQCGILFFDFSKTPIICPSCGLEVNSLLTNVSKRGRPPKVAKVEEKNDEEDMKIEEIDVAEDIEDVNSDDEPVEEIIEIEKEED